jgi:DNA (cytosine-5)-methyltransferase 1
VNALSLFSGAGGMDLGLDRAGITAVAHCEIDPKAQSVLRRHWPDVPVISDVREVTSDVGRVDLVHGGFPCQDISVAGNRKGLAGDRSGLWWEFHRILGELRPRWCVIENVAGLLSSNGGRDLGAILGALGDLGYGYAYRVLDARHFGVPQRRRRVFIVGHLGGRGAAKVLLEPEGVRRDSAAGREAGQIVAALTANGVGAGGGPDDNSAQAGHLIAYQCQGSNVGEMGTLRAGNGGVTGGVPFLPQHTGTVTTAFDAKNYSNLQEVVSGHVIAVAFAENQRGEVRTSDVMPSLTDGGGKPGQGYPAVLEGGSLAVRRLTPKECERQRLMGWPDDWTRYADDGAEIADSHRYRMCGNGVVAPVAEWIGRRIMEVAS